MKLSAPTNDDVIHRVVHEGCEDLTPEGFADARSAIAEARVDPLHPEVGGLGMAASQRVCRHPRVIRMIHLYCAVS
jgi:hypothetical protein